MIEPKTYAQCTLYSFQVLGKIQLGILDIICTHVNGGMSSMSAWIISQNDKNALL